MKNISFVVLSAPHIEQTYDTLNAAVAAMQSATAQDGTDRMVAAVIATAHVTRQINVVVDVAQSLNNIPVVLDQPVTVTADTTS